MRKHQLTAAFIILFGISLHTTFAQNRVECEKIVATTVNAINTQTPEQLEKFLAPDFTIAGQKAPMANKVLDMLIKQLNEEVKDYKKTSETEANGELTLVYEFTYATRGQQTTTFVFDSNNRLKQLDLLKMQVKTMGKDETKVEKSEQEIITIPFEVHDGLLTAKATVNGESRTFIIDNGSPRLILNSKYFKGEGGDVRSISDTKGVNSTVSNMDIIQVKEFDFYGIKIRESKVLTMDITHLEKEMGAEIYGLIGYDVFKDYDMLFDYAAGTLTLLQPNATSSYLEKQYSQSNIEEIPMELRRHLPFVKVKIGKEELNFGVDCGASSCLVEAKLHDSLKKQIKKSENVDLKGGGETRNVEAGKLKKLTIGKRVFKKIDAVFNDMSHLNTAYNMQLDGLIGYGILSKQKTLLQFQSKKLLFITD